MQRKVAEVVGLVGVDFQFDGLGLGVVVGYDA